MNGTIVYVSDKGRWCEGTVQSCKDEIVTVKLRNRRTVTSLASKVLQKNQVDALTIDSLTSLEHLHEPGISRVLTERYQKDKIYTLTGSTIVAMNPFQGIKGLYSQETKDRVREMSGLETEPHVYGLVEGAIRNLKKDDPKDQVFLVSGESGSGKTETAKIIMGYLCDSDTATDLQHDIQASNPIMEAFGNAATTRNHNSSRFGKFIKMQFDHECNLVGAHIEPYLLEKVRVCGPAKRERNYNIFYQFLAGVNKKKLGIGSSEKWKCMGTTKPTKRDGELWKETKEALSAYQFSDEDIEDIQKILLSCLRLSNIDFDTDEDDYAKVKSTKALELLASSLSCDQDTLRDALTYRTMVLRGETVKRCLRIEQAKALRDTVQKDLYEALFNHIIDRINQHINSDDASYIIGVLDIFGFESMEENGFEQLCINFANEKLQKLLNIFTFDRQVEEYKEEGVELPAVDYRDNQHIIDLIELRPTGILPMLSDECRLPKGSVDNLMQKFARNHPSNEAGKVEGHPDDHKILINHYAGPVQYSTGSFMDRNKKQSNASLSTILDRTENTVGQVLGNYLVKSSDSATVAGIFIKQLTVLIDLIKTADQHYIRCIKPNDLSQTRKVDGTKLAEQLRAGGVVEAAKVARSGYPIRLSHQQYITRYHMLCWKVPRMIETVIAHTCPSATLGRTKVFMTVEDYQPLEERRSMKMKVAAITIQSLIRMVTVKRWYQEELARKEKVRIDQAMTIGEETAKFQAQTIVQEMLNIQPINQSMLRIKPRKKEKTSRLPKLPSVKMPSMPKMPGMPKMPSMPGMKTLSRYRKVIAGLAVSNAVCIGVTVLVIAL